MVAWRAGEQSARAQAFAKLVVEGARLRRVDIDGSVEIASGDDRRHHLSAEPSRP